ncbi:hypothetical protein MKX01_022264 [Papaver californicum]|nr:hypothetical protein MKX01_022264 [Papaver californicum]
MSLNMLLPRGKQYSFVCVLAVFISCLILEHYVPFVKPITTVGSFTVEDRLGEQWIRLRRKYEEEDIKIESTIEQWIRLRRKYEEEDIQIESTIFDETCPTPKISDNDTDDEDRKMQLRISLIVNIFRSCSCAGVMESCESVRKTEF